ncbi:hypothetical protein [Burkholderia pseudomallei]|uniref:hypothetical protein n=1 Tax=Burkholderia pseudomallei TaxID=28450 RepID=UPI0015C3867A|nr:hypothetical protein [Burkholderia pseudomallei]
MPHLFEETGLSVSVAGDTGLRESEFGCRRRADQTPAIRLPHSMPASRAGACGSSRTDGKRVASERGNGNGNGNGNDTTRHDTTRHDSDHDLTNRNGRQSPSFDADRSAPSRTPVRYRPDGLPCATAHAWMRWNICSRRSLAAIRRAAGTIAARDRLRRQDVGVAPAAATSFGSR